MRTASREEGRIPRRRSAGGLDGPQSRSTEPEGPRSRKQAWFLPHPTREWTQILGEAGPMEIITPYHDGSLIRDTNFINPFRLMKANAGDGGLCASIHEAQSPCPVGPNDDPPADPSVIREIRDRGILWKSDCETRRSEELAVWAGRKLR